MTERDEGRRVVRNVVAIGAFALSPVQMFLLVRALGTAGYGRWWSTFVIVEAAGILGMFGAELFVRREVPQITDDDQAVAVVGSSLALAGIAGLVLAALQVVVAGTLARAQGDAELVEYLTIFAAQPVLLNLTMVVGAALQSRDVLLPVAIVRGIFVPVGTCTVLLVGWQAELPIRATLIGMLVVVALGFAITLAIYARHFPLGQTLRDTFRPRRAAAALRYGSDVFVAAVLLTLGGKVDLYFLGAYRSTLVVALYGAALQVSSGVPNIRMLFDPIIQKQVGALQHEPAKLADSLHRLARMCALCLAPAFAVTVALGEPFLRLLVGGDVDATILPLIVVTTGNLLGFVAVASWLAPMFRAGRPYAFVAGSVLVVKLALLVILVPRYGAVGAAFSTGIATVLVLHGQAIVGAHGFGVRSMSADLVPILAAALAVGAGGRLLYVTLVERMAILAATVATAAASGLVLLVALAILMTRDERAAIMRMIGRHRSPSTDRRR